MFTGQEAPNISFWVPLGEYASLAVYHDGCLHWGGGGGGGAFHCLLDSGLSIDAFLSCLEAWLLYMIYI